MRRAIASLCVCWLAWCAAEPTNNIPLAFGMSIKQAEVALGAPLQRLPGHAGFYYATGPLDIPGYYATGSVLALQFRGGRLTGWKQDFALHRCRTIDARSARRLMVPLSVLDLSPVAAGSSGAVALHNSLDLARLADALGYTRYWVAEHHNLPSIASSAPEIMIGQIAAATTRMRVGSGGVMLPNHAPLMVVERFKVLEALFPGRIDLGIGRAPGTDPVTSYALRRRQDGAGGDDFLERFQELMLFERDGFPADHPFSKVHAMPRDTALPPIWLLGSSGYSAELAAVVGAGFSFAHHFSDHDAVAPMRFYRDHFKPSATLAQPYSILGCAVVCADTEIEAEHHAATLDLHWVRRAQGQHLPLASPEEAQAYPYTPIDRERIKARRARLFLGTPASVVERLSALIRQTRADEVMVTTMIYDHAARRHSYELLAQAFGLEAA